jgi:hypothetical protein
MLTGWLRYARRVGTEDQGDIEDFLGEGDAWAALFADVVHGAAVLEEERGDDWRTWRDTEYVQFTVFRVHHDPGGELGRWAAEQGMDLGQAGRWLARDPSAGPLDLVPSDGPGHTGIEPVKPDHLEDVVAEAPPDKAPARPARPARPAPGESPGDAGAAEGERVVELRRRRDPKGREG